MPKQVQVPVETDDGSARLGNHAEKEYVNPAAQSSTLPGPHVDEEPTTPVLHSKNSDRVFNNEELHYDASALSQANEVGACDEGEHADESKSPQQLLTPRALEPRASATENGALQPTDFANVEVSTTENNYDGLSDDESWTFDIGDEEDDEDDDLTQWKLQSIKSIDFSLGFNVTDRKIEEKYLQEVKEVKKRVIEEHRAITRTFDIQSLSESDILNVYFPAEVLMPILAFMNRHLQVKKTPPTRTSPQKRPHRSNTGSIVALAGRRRSARRQKTAEKSSVIPGEEV